MQLSSRIPRAAIPPAQENWRRRAYERSAWITDSPVAQDRPRRSGGSLACEANFNAVDRVIKVVLRNVLGLGIAALLIGCGGSVAPSGPVEGPAVSAKQHLVVLHSFAGGSDGADPVASLTDVNGTFYGTTMAGGKDGHGTVFRITPGGAERVLWAFVGASDGEEPISALLLRNGVLYGTTFKGGTFERGAAFAIDAGGAVSVLHDFGRLEDDGAFPSSPLILLSGAFIGTALNGGTNLYGTVFALNRDGRERVIRSFSSTTGSAPTGALTEVGDALYGTTAHGPGIWSFGTIFSMHLNGSGYRVMHRFSHFPDGAVPTGGLLFVKGKFYGTTFEGGAENEGTIFRCDLEGRERIVHSFGEKDDGARPYGTLIEYKGHFYGTTLGGGSHGKGTIFSSDLDGNANVLYSFSGLDGAKPAAGLIVRGDALYGTTRAGGDHGKGTVFAYHL